MNGLAAFIARRSLTGVLALVAVVVIIMVVLHAGTCAQIDAKIAQIRQQIADEIIAKGITFSSVEERRAYEDTRLQQEKTRLGLDICT